MVMLVASKEDATDYEPYQKRDQVSLFIDPFGNETEVPHDNNVNFEQQMADLFKPWEKQTAMEKLARNEMIGWDTVDKNGRPKIGVPKAGKGLQYDYFEVMFHPDEVDTDEKRERAFAAVVEWAKEGDSTDAYHGRRAFEIHKIWHEDGQTGMPHLRVATNRVIYQGTLEDHRLAGPMARSEGGAKKTDTKRLGAILEKNGFPGMRTSYRGQSGEIINLDMTAGSRNDRDSIKDNGNRAVDDYESKYVQGTAAGEAQPDVMPDRMTQTAMASDILQRAMAAEAAKIRQATENLARFEAAFKAELDAAARSQQIRVLESEQLDLANKVKSDLATIAPDFEEATKDLPLVEVVREGLKKHVEIETELRADLDTRLAELTAAIQNSEKQTQERQDMEAQISETIFGILDAEELEEYADSPIEEKVAYAGQKYHNSVRQVEKTASQLRDTERDWLNTKNELDTTRTDLEAKTEELTSAKADIDGAIALLRNDMPELFKDNPDLEKSMRASMEAAIQHSKEVAQERDELASKLRETEAAKEHLEEQNDTLAQQNKVLKTDLEKMQDERDEARQQLADVTVKLEDATKTVTRLETSEANIRRLANRGEEGWEAKSTEEAVASLKGKADELAMQRNTAVSQVEFYKEQITTLSTKVDKLEERLEEQRRDTQEQLAKQQQAHSQQMIDLVAKGQVSQNQGNVPTQGVGQPRTTPTQGPTTNPGPQKKGPSIDED